MTVREQENKGRQTTDAGDASPTRERRKSWSVWPFGKQSSPWQRRAAWIAGGVVALIFVAGLLFLGFESHRHRIQPVYSVFAKIDDKIQSTLFSLPPRLANQEYTTALINLASTVGAVDTGRSGRNGPMAENGGGIAAFGSDVVLLPYNGKVYAARDANSVRQTKIFGPDNGRAAYLALRDDAEIMRKYNINFSSLRYNDLAYYDTGQERGLLASFTEFNRKELCYTDTLAVLPIPRTVTSIDEVTAQPSDWRVVFRTAPCLAFKTEAAALEGQMAGGRVVFQAPSTVYMTVGDFHFDGMRANGSGIAQDPVAQYGKVLKVDIATGKADVVSMGHRNPQGIVLSREGKLMTVEHGPQGGDELNVIRPGANYGWPLESYGTTYRGGPIPYALSYGRHQTFEKPAFAWVPSIGASAMIQVEGFDPAWDGDLLVGNLMDNGIHRVRMEGDRGVYAEPIRLGTRVRDLLQLSDKRIAAWSDNGELIFLEPRPHRDAFGELEEYMSDRGLGQDMQVQLRTAMDRCAECHSLSADNHTRSPGLGQVFGADVAGTSFANYSEALRRKGGRWTKESLTAFLSNPDAFAPGTAMPNPNLKPEVVREIVGFFEVLRTRF